MSGKDGGPAFPITVRRDEKYMDEAGYGKVRAVQGLEGGMTLRDWFAGQALAGVNAATEQEAARFAYAVADAMLAERAK